ncbi:MAG: DNA polymerase I [Firmicutes bacterium]|nr:DNA polymerase I [Bacillota bacterium]
MAAEQKQRNASGRKRQPTHQGHLVLVDGNSVANRAFYALPLLSTRSGQYTNGLYGFGLMLFKLLGEVRPTHLLVAFDAGKETFRTKQYAAYKGTRQKTPQELSEQLPLIKEMLDAFGIAHTELPNFEADDIIGTLALRGAAEGFEVTIYTGDRDLLQLVNDAVTVLLTRKGVTDVKRYDVHAILDEYGLPPSGIVELKGLMGDSSDNIPGVPGVGEKTALKLLHQFGDVEGVLAHIDDVDGPKLRQRLKENKESARLSRQLATIDCDVPLELSWEQLELHSFDREAVTSFLRKYELNALLQRLESLPNEIFDEPKEASEQLEDVRALKVIAEAAQIAEALDQLQAPVAVIPAFCDANYYDGPFLGLGIADGTQGFFFPADVLFSQEGKAAIGKKLSQGGTLFFDAKRTMVRLRREGVTPFEPSEDLLLAGYLINPTDGEQHLQELCKTYLTSTPEGIAQLYPRQNSRVEDLAQWSAAQARAMLALLDVLLPRLRKDALESLYREVELPLVGVLTTMELNGIAVDVERLKAIGAELEDRIAAITQKIYDTVGTSFNLNSPKQLGEILFEKLGLTPIKKTKTGYSTSAEVLEKLAPQHPVVQMILDYRTIEKLRSTYIDGLLAVIKPETHKIHTRFHQALTATGRLSSSDPNLQNIPIRLEEGRRLRAAFVASQPGWRILSSDYSQIELRVLAHLSQDERMIRAFVEGEDIHAETAAALFGVKKEEVTPEMRRHAKTVNFGIVYGISDYGLSERLGISRKEAASFIAAYFERFSGVKAYLDHAVEMAREKGYVTTLLNRRRYLPEIRSSNYNARSFAERTAMNTPIQGSAADIIKKAMIEVSRRLQQEQFQSRMLLQIHDELVFEFPKSEEEQLRGMVQEVMEHVFPLRVPLVVDIHVGDTWYDAK